MEPLNDKELNRLLRQWEAPAAPASLRVPGGPRRPSRWQWLWSGSIRIPIPIGAAIVIVVAVFGIYSSRPEPRPALQPMAIPNATSPAAVSPAAPAATAQAAQPVPETLAGFRPVVQIEPRLIGGHQ